MNSRGKSLSNLECGNLSSPYNHSNDLVQIQLALQKKLIFFTSKLLSCNFRTEEAQSFAPFYARNILETSATALLARIDRFVQLLFTKFKMIVAIQ